MHSTRILAGLLGLHLVVNAPTRAAEASPARPAAIAAAPSPAAALTYTKDIAPIFQRRCQECHRPGEAAPMSLLAYSDVRKWKIAIRKEVASGAMPPWHASPEHGSWRNDRRLAEAEKASILDWIAAGATEGDPADLPPPRAFLEGWRLGEPDLVLQMPSEYVVKAEGTVPYKYFTIPTNFTEDKWVRAVEVRPGSRAVVHHIICFVLPPEQRRLDERGIWRSHLAGIAPGEDPDVFPAGCGKRIPAGSRLVFQMHYTPNGVETVDRSRIGLHFSDDEGRTPLRPVHVRAAMNPWFKIPAGAAAHPVESSFTFRKDAQLLSLMPHMHLRGKSFRFEHVASDGSQRILLDVPRYDFDWQHNYIFATPLAVKAGDKIVCSALFDNSKDNPENPDPTTTVRWGDQTWQEMMIGFLGFLDEEGAAVDEASSADGDGDAPLPPASKDTRSPDAKQAGSAG